MTRRPNGIPRPGWQRDAACRGQGEDAFFGDDRVTRQVAVDVCGACPVRRDCLEYALAERISVGIWGGLTERQRGAIAMDRRRQLRAAR